MHEDVAVASHDGRECIFSSGVTAVTSDVGFVHEYVAVASDGGRECRFSGGVAYELCTY